MDRLKTHRSRKDFTQAELADEAGVSKTIIALVESQNYQPSDTIKQAIAKALGVTVNEIEEFSTN